MFPKPFFSESVDKNMASFFAGKDAVKFFHGLSVIIKMLSVVCPKRVITGKLAMLWPILPGYSL